MVSDWGACHSTAPSINAGLDIEMPEGRNYSPENIMAALAAKSITEDQLHESCIRIMSGWYNLPVDKRYPCNGGNCIQNNVSTPEHKVSWPVEASEAISVCTSTATTTVLGVNFIFAVDGVATAH
jgi:hypothetical protein